ncbi:FAD dependent oxidoreductase [Zopfochytrium polystomum]|nr:FAD dependent oxidoreductase [Zopfochytrium polystomum]
MPQLPVPSPLPSHWLEGVSLGSTRPFPAQDGEDNRFDVAVIGAGFAGAATAWHLRRLRPHCRIAVLDARDVAGGATGRNGGLLWPGLSDPFHELVSAFGVENTLTLLRFDHENVAEIIKFCKIHRETGDTLDPLLAPFSDGAFASLDTEEAARKAKADLEAIVRAGVPDAGGLKVCTANKVVEIVGSDPVLAQSGALVSSHAFRVVPPRLVLGILRAATASAGSRPALPGTPAAFFADTPVVDVLRRTDSAAAANPSTSRFILITPRGKILAHKIVHATNAWSSSLLPLLPVTPIRNQVISTKPVTAAPNSDGAVGRWVNGTFCVSANHGYEYMSGRGDGRIVMGGMRFLAPGDDVGVADDASLNPVVSRAIRGYLDERIPALRGKVVIDKEWAGIMGWTNDGLPFVGELPREFIQRMGNSKASGGGRSSESAVGSGSGEFIVAGFSGHGMPRCFLSGRAVAEMIAEAPLSDSFPRLFLPTIERLSIKENKDTFRSKM